jgi:non-ribosomal peptide synthetase component F
VVPFNDARRLNLFCQEQSITVAMLMQAAWAVVLKLYTGLTQDCFGCLRSDQEALPGAAGILGPLISMLPCKFIFDDLKTATVKNLLGTSQHDTSIAMKHSGCSLAKLHDELGLSESPLFDTVMAIQHAWPANLGGGGDLVIETVDAVDPCEYAILVGVQYSEDKLLIGLSYERTRVSDSFAERIAGTFGRVIEIMI